jgi:hypothetical protein
MDHNRVLQLMGRSLNEFFLTAVRTGAEVPKQLEPLLRRMIESGDLIDENGEKFDLSALDAIHWSDTITANIQKVIDKLDELIRTITGKLGQSIEDIPPLEIPIGPPMSTRDRAERSQQARASTIPAFASEAFVRRPTMALLGEDPEFVLKPSTIANWLGQAATGGGGGNTAAVVQAVNRLAAKLDGLVLEGDVLMESESVGRIVGKHRATQQALVHDIATNVNGLATSIRMAARGVR